MNWGNLMDMYASTGKQQTQQRKHNEFKQPRWNELRHKDISQTNGCDFLELLNKGGAMTQIYLSRHPFSRLIFRGSRWNTLNYAQTD